MKAFYIWLIFFFQSHIMAHIIWSIFYGSTSSGTSTPVRSSIDFPKRNGDSLWMKNALKIMLTRVKMIVNTSAKMLHINPENTFKIRYFKFSIFYKPSGSHRTPISPITRRMRQITHHIILSTWRIKAILNNRFQKSWIGNLPKAIPCNQIRRRQDRKCQHRLYHTALKPPKC